MKKQEEHINNTYAFDVESNRIHISQAESGRNGYFCMGCKVQMEARKGRIREHYFAHIPKEIGVTRKCTYSDETYRHKLARHILVKLKKVTVPTVYIYPPNGKDGKPQIVRKKHVIVAKSATTEKSVFENELGQIKIGADAKSREKNILFRPDVIFYNEQEEPILFIEVVATHKVNKDKLIKLKRIGIDCIAITIPKTSPQDIENTFLKTNRTKWLFNYEKEITTYIPNTSRNKSSIPSLDKFERKLLRTEESYECRKAEIGNVIRAIRRSLESEQYRDVEEYLNNEIKRTEENTEFSKDKWRAIEERTEREVNEEFRVEEESLKREEDDVREREEKSTVEITIRRDWVEESYRELEDRYNNKRRRIEQDQTEYRGGRQSEIDRIEQEIRKIEDRRNRSNRNIERLKIKIRDTYVEYQSYREHLPIRWNEYKSIKQSLEGKIKAEERSIEEFYEKETRRIELESEEKGRELQETFRQDRVRTIEAYETEDPIRLPGDRKLLARLIRAKEALGNITEGKSSIRLFDTAKKLYEEKSYESWY